MMEYAETSLDARVAGRVRQLRAASDLTLEALAQRSGVSRSMISLIERGETSATAVVLDKLATALGVTLASLFEPPRSAPRPLVRAGDQPPWRDPASGYVRRNVSPSGWPTPVQIVDVTLPARAHVAFETSGRRDAPIVQQQVWVLAGRIEISLGDERHRLDEGDCLAMHLDRPVAFHNPTRKASRYAVVLHGGAS